MNLISQIYSDKFTDCMKLFNFIMKNESILILL
jgi:hypothetical protein